jgi:hypothetical protein
MEDAHLRYIEDPAKVSKWDLNGFNDVQAHIGV